MIAERFLVASTNRAIYTLFQNKLVFCIAGFGWEIQLGFIEKPALLGY